MSHVDHLHPREVEPEDMDLARELLETEMEVVKDGMTHGDLSLEAYTQVIQSSALLTPAS